MCREDKVKAVMPYKLVPLSCFVFVERKLSKK